MGNKVIVTFDRGRLPYGRKLDILLQGRCSVFFTAAAVMEGDVLHMYYDTTGYIRIADIEKISAAGILVIIKDLLDAAEEGRDFLFDPGEYVISPDTVYTDRSKGGLKLVYIPEERRISWERTLKNFFRRLEPLTTESGVMYLGMIDNMIASSNPTREKILYFIDELLAEARICRT